MNENKWNCNGMEIILPEGFIPMEVKGDTILCFGSGPLPYVTWRIRKDGGVDNGTYFQDLDDGFASLNNRGGRVTVEEVTQEMLDADKTAGAQIYDWKRREYRPYRLPVGSSVDPQENETVTCARCGKPVGFMDSWTSMAIHSPMGFGYAVCNECHEAEWDEREKYDEKYKALREED